MRNSVLAGVSLSLFALSAQAQVSRVFVSVNGNDGNVCSNVATPCRTFAGGITQVDADGEVIVTESGSYAGGTITKAVKINVPTGLVAFSGLPIVVNPGAGKKVVLRGLTLKALAVGSDVGINHQSGTLYVENMVVDGWNAGLQSQNGAERLFVKGSVFRNNAGSGLTVMTGSTAIVTIDQSFFESNLPGSGIVFNGGTARVSSSVMTGNTFGGAVQLTGQATFQRCEVSGNVTGLYAAYGGVLRVSGSTVTSNSPYYGLENYADTATLESFGNNVVRDNASNISGTITTGALQ